MDIKQLAAELGGYLAVFADRSLVPEKAREQAGEKESVVQKIRGAKNGPAPPKKTPGDKKPEPEL
jgi:hypothetical protein